MKLGNIIAAAATPIARSLKLPCVDPETNDLRPDSACAKRKAWLNNLSDKMYDTFWPTTSDSNTTMAQYIINKQIAVEAESPEEAVTEMVAGKGKTTSFTVGLRPSPAVPQMAGQARPNVQPVTPPHLLTKKTP